MFLATLAPFLLFAAFVLLLLVSLSAPIIDSIYLFRLSATTAGAQSNVNFGVWGYCAGAVKTALGILSDGSCSKARLGYRIDSIVARALGVSGITDSISRALTAIFILNPIAAGLTFLAFLISLFMLRKGANGTARLPSFLTFGLGTLAALATTAAFIANLVIVSIVRKRIRDDLGGGDVLDFTWGNAIWMTLGAMVALWLALVGALCGICGFGAHRRKRNTATY
ncbi:hypothetical protein FA13DRAFT_1732703 [Coprinellus micaceus]|uniref:Pali-domain-containing protein n=1 Tax=Coprinellus micaceus TaxID=71717 RepID=A0A4Y7TB85_COPMI|nr:hypothetical protein FA13DRAFT_1732703 [Coprinellus micaceus]